MTENFSMLYMFLVRKEVSNSIKMFYVVWQKKILTEFIELKICLD